MAKLITTLLVTSFLFSCTANASEWRLPNIFGNSSKPAPDGRREPRLPPAERRRQENAERFIRLREHARLSSILSAAYLLRGNYVVNGACAAVRAQGISGVCSEASSPFGELDQGIAQSAVRESDAAFARYLAQEGAKWRTVAATEKDEVAALCRAPSGRCSTGKKFQYWEVDSQGNVINEDVEMLEFAKTVTEERLITHILGSVAKEGLFSSSANGGDPKLGFQVLERIRELPNLPIAQDGYFKGEFLPLSGQAATRKKLLKEAGLSNLEAIE